MSDRTAGLRAIIRKVLRWGRRLAVVIVLIVVGLVIADSMHQKECHGGASHKGESYEFIGERLTLLNTGQETNGEVLVIDVSFKPTAETNVLKWQEFHFHPHQEERLRSSRVPCAFESVTGNRF